MRKDFLRIAAIFIITVVVVYWFLSSVFLKSGPRSRATGETVEITYDPSSVSQAANTDFTVSVKIKPSVDIALRGYQLKLGFDKSKLTAKKIEYKLGVASGDLGDSDASLGAVNQNGVVNLVGEINSATSTVVSALSASELAKLTFTIAAATGTTISGQKAGFYITASDTNLSQVEVTTIPNLNVNGGGPTVTPISGTPGLTPTGGGNTTLNLKLKFQGITKKPDDKYNTLKVKVKAVCGSVSGEGSGDFKADDSGVWSGAVSFNLSSTANKCYLYLKGQKHLQRKICDIAPSETEAGTYRCSDAAISLSGQNSLDFSKIILLSGDLNQDGIVKADDIALIKNNLGKTDEAVLKQVDVNLDGRIDTQDYSLVIAALSVRTDEQ